MKNNKTRVLTNNNGVLKKYVGNIGCVNLDIIFFSFCTMKVILKVLRIETLHKKNTMSQNSNRIYVIIIQQYVRAKSMGFKV